MTLLLLVPTKWDPDLFTRRTNSKARIFTIWKTESILKIGRISAPVNDPGFKEKGPRERAALLFADCFLSKLFSTVEEQGKECFAPPFGIVPAKANDQLPTVDAWQRDVRDSKRRSREFIEPTYSHSISGQIPKQGTMEEHNSLRKKSKGHGKKSDLILHRSLVWFPCGTVAEWIALGEQTSTWLQKSRDDVEALVHFSIWRHTLTEMGKIGANCLFSFDSIYVPSVV